MRVVFYSVIRQCTNCIMYLSFSNSAVSIKHARNNQTLLFHHDYNINSFYALSFSFISIFMLGSETTDLQYHDVVAHKLLFYYRYTNLFYLEIFMSRRNNDTNKSTAHKMLHRYFVSLLNLDKSRSNKNLGHICQCGYN